MLLNGEILEDIRNGRDILTTIKDVLSKQYNVKVEDFTITYTYHELYNVYEVTGRYDKPI